MSQKLNNENFELYPTFMRNLLCQNVSILSYVHIKNDNSLPNMQTIETVTKIPDKIFGTKWSNPIKLGRKRKVWYLFL